MIILLGGKGNNKTTISSNPIQIPYSPKLYENFWEFELYSRKHKDTSFTFSKGKTKSYSDFISNLVM